MMLYHNLMEWIEQEDQEDPGFFTKMAKKGVAFVPIMRADEQPEHPLIVKWTPIFQEALKDGIQIVHYKNPITKENDITMLVFDNRQLKQRLGLTLCLTWIWQNTTELWSKCRVRGKGNLQYNRIGRV